MVFDLRIDGPLFEKVRAHIEDDSRGEEAGFLICSESAGDGRVALLARDWIPIPEWAVERGDGLHDSVLAWSAEFSSRVIERALEPGAGAVLVHSHGTFPAKFSGDDVRREPGLLAPMSRLLEPLHAGTVVVGGGAVVGSFWQDGERAGELGRLVVIADTITTTYPPGAAPPARARKRLDRQNVAIGPHSDAALAAATVAVIGISGGGSHVVQQLAHQGVGRIIAVDDDIVDESNLGRVVGAVENDIGRTHKTDLAERVAKSIDASIEIVKVPDRFPTPRSIAALKQADIVVACVDRFDVRADINTFCRRHLLPLVDIGISLLTVGERLARADGQLTVSLPGRPCMRCWFLTDAVLAEERHNRPPGYDRNPDAKGDPQVVSMNGVLASEACNCVLDLLTSYSGGARGARTWQYDGRRGELTSDELPPARRDCPACAEEGRGDPPPRR